MIGEDATAAVDELEPITVYQVQRVIVDLLKDGAEHHLLIGSAEFKPPDLELDREQAVH